MSWFLTGQLISLGALGYLAHTSFNVPYWMSCIAVVISFFLADVYKRQVWYVLSQGTQYIQPTDHYTAAHMTAV